MLIDLIKTERLIFYLAMVTRNSNLEYHIFELHLKKNKVIRLKSRASAFSEKVGQTDRQTDRQTRRQTDFQSDL